MSDPIRDPAAVPQAMTEADLKAHIAATPALARLFPAGADGLQITEIGDGNLNFVFFVHGPDNALAIKQALPWSRVSKGARALNADRLGYETRALQVFGGLAPDHVPQVHHYDPDRALMAQTFLTGHRVLRQALLEAADWPHLADHMAEYLVACLLGTSPLGMIPSDRRRLAAEFSGNIALCEITERLVFTQPFTRSDANRWSRPALDDAVHAMQADPRVQMRVRDLKHAFLTRAEALLHGDLHSGSIMLTVDSTQIIDPEFAIFGPMGFDIGMFLGNLMLSCFAQPGWSREPGAAQARLRAMVTRIWEGFAAGFTARAMAPAPGTLLDGLAEPARAAWIARHLDGVLQDSVGFAAIEMVRRLIGAAHVADFDAIKDAPMRARCEAAALAHAARLLGHEGRFPSIDALAQG